jgi:hypothetical protein
LKRDTADSFFGFENTFAAVLFVEIVGQIFLIEQGRVLR